MCMSGKICRILETGIKYLISPYPSPKQLTEEISRLALPPQTLTLSEKLHVVINEINTFVEIVRDERILPIV